MKGLYAFLLSIIPIVLCSQSPLPVLQLPFVGNQADTIPRVLILPDKGGQLTRQAAWEALNQGQYMPIDSFDIPGRFEIGQYHFWAAFVVENISSDTLDYLLSIAASNDTLWYQQAGKYRLAVRPLGSFPDFMKRQLLPYKTTHFSSIRLLPKQYDTCFLHLNHYTQFGIFLPVISEPNAYMIRQFEQKRYGVFFLIGYFGVVFSFFLFAAAFYWNTKDRILLWYIGYLACLMWTSWRNVETNLPELYSTFYLASWGWTRIFEYAGYFCFYTLFVRSFLREDGRGATRMNGIVQFVIWISLVVVFVHSAALFNGYLYESWILYYAFRVLITLSSCCFLWVLWREGNIWTRYVFIGTACVLLGELISLFYTSIYATTFSGIGALLEVAFFSIGLGYRSKVYRKAHEELLQQHIEQLEENERLMAVSHQAEIATFKNRFYDNITHEFRTPLTVLLGVASLLRENVATEVRVAGQSIIRNGQQLLQLVNQLLDLSKMESGTLQLYLVQGDVIPYLRVTVESFASLAAIKQQSFYFQTHDEHLMMDYDPERLQQVLSNLIGNALKFTPEAGSIRVNAQYDTQEKQLTVTVSDTGMGIDSALLPHIFDRFYQIPDASIHQTKGTGIGLSLAKELVTSMGGTLNVTSNLGEGSEFTLHLPVTQNADFAPTIYVDNWTQMPPQIEVQQAELPLLLLVEDNLDLVQYLSMMLHGHYRVLVAHNGSEGLSEAFEHLPDIVVSDVMMPGMDGFEFCTQLKNDMRTSHIPVVMLTARVAVSDKIQGLKRGADAWLTKPFNRAELFATLTAMLESRARLRAYFQQDSTDEPTAEIADWVEKEHEFLALIRDFVDTHLEEPNDIKQLCQYLGMSKTQLYRKLQALGSVTAAQLMQDHRLDIARSHLETTNQTIAEIAFQTGFSDPAYFSNCFKKKFGKPPSWWRK